MPKQLTRRRNRAVDKKDRDPAKIADDAAMNLPNIPENTRLLRIEHESGYTQGRIFVPNPSISLVFENETVLRITATSEQRCKVDFWQGKNGEHVPSRMFTKLAWSALSKKLTDLLRATLAPPKRKITGHYFEIYRDKRGEFRVRFRYNKEIMFSTEGYTSKASAENAIHSIKRNGPDAPVEDNS